MTRARDNADHYSGATAGIANTNHLVANANVADNDFLRVDGASIEGRTAAETLSDIGGIGASNPTVTLGSNTTFPANHATNTLVWKILITDYNGSGSIWNSASVSFSAVSGKTYEISAFYNGNNYRKGPGTENRRDVYSRLYVHNATTSQGTYATTGTLVAAANYGRMTDQATTSRDAYSFYGVNLIGYFVCGATETVYIRVNTEGQSGDQNVISKMSATNPAWVIVREFPTLTITEVT